jgi:tRNA(Arg) A34 adenosine deaminase TadA
MPAELDDLTAPWPEVFSLVWEAYLAGTIPVGAVVVDAAGEIVNRGRNRIFDDPREGQLGRTRLAHAELNALVPLTSERSYQGFTLYTAVEPCHLCLSAAITVHIGRLRYAAPDPYAGAVGRLVPNSDHEAHPLVVEGPLGGAPGRLPEALHVAHFLWRVPDGPAARFYRRFRPDLVTAARRLPAPDADATLADAFAALDA